MRNRGKTLATVMLLYGDLNCVIGVRRLTIVQKTRKLAPMSVAEGYSVSE